MNGWGESADDLNAFLVRREGGYNIIAENKQLHMCIRLCEAVVSPCVLDASGCLALTGTYRDNSRPIGEI